MKKFLIVVVLSQLLNAASAQSLPMGKAQFNVGVGLSAWGVPVYAGIDYSIIRDVTIGGEISYRSYREGYKNEYYRHNIFGILANGNYHFNHALKMPDKFDLYAGLSLGYFSWTSSDKYLGTHASGIGLGAQIGGRWFFSKKIGLNLEIAGGSTIVGGKLGLTIKM